jgi:hypothetical protein
MGGGTGSRGITLARAGSSSVSGQEFYDAIRPVAETLEAYVADGRLLSNVVVGAKPDRGSGSSGYGGRPIRPAKDTMCSGRASRAHSG